jgi:hypothetical protein
MMSSRQTSGGARRRRPPAAPGAGNVLELDHARILRALARRQRYKYVQPRVLREGAGWKIVSPNCSRTVDSTGGEIDIAWLVPGDAGGWLLHARDHRQSRWVLKASGVTLADALSRICADPGREYWQ